jgi:beta-glucuronidase
MLYPIESPTRERRDLGGIWRFRRDAGDEGERGRWWQSRLPDPIDMPVPASYNDVTQDTTLRDHVGIVWYEREFFLSEAWRGKRCAIRFGSVTHHARVWINGVLVTQHKGGFLPFEASLGDAAVFGGRNRVTVEVDNRLDWSCLPPGEVQTTPDGRKLQWSNFDFFNYAGIHRPVWLVAVPQNHVRDIKVVTQYDKSQSHIEYTLEIEGPDSRAEVTLLNEDEVEVAHSEGPSGVLGVQKATPWAPGAPYLYTLGVRLLGQKDLVEDEYDLPVGIRSIEVRGSEFLINGTPFYFRGFGKHEDSDLRGKGHDDVLNVKDMNLMRACGANSFRTSHYPYSEELMQLADRWGFAVIDEAPCVGANTWNDADIFFRPERINEATLAHHRDVMRDLIARDKNHACVVMWSLANEASTQNPGAEPYFRDLAAYTRELDPTRPLTIVETTGAEKTRVADFCDVICINRYIGWYVDQGHLDRIEPELEKELRLWWDKYGKPIIVSEYGADAVAGMHADPPVMFTEEYQAELLAATHRVFDRTPWLVGEHVWNFADFMTKQGTIRVLGNRKGVLTRQRQPKAAFRVLKDRWTKLGGDVT